MKIETLPRGEFVLTTPDGKQVRGKLGTWSFQRFCEKQKIGFADIADHFQYHLTLNDAVQFLLSAIEYPFVRDRQICPYTDIDVCDWIDQEGGLKSLGDGWFNKLLDHGFPKEESTGEEKKIIVETIHGQTLQEPAVLQV